MPAAERSVGESAFAVAAWGGFLPFLDDHQVAAFDLRHDAREDAVDQRVKGWVAGEVVRNMDLEAFVGGDGRGDRLQDVLEGRHGERLEVVPCLMSVDACVLEDEQHTKTSQCADVPAHLLRPSLSFLVLLYLLDGGLCLAHCCSRCRQYTAPPSSAALLRGRGAFHFIMRLCRRRSRCKRSLCP